MKKNACIIFVKNPSAGKVKTRIAKTLGDEAALQIYEQLLSLTLALALQTDAQSFVFYSDFIDEADQWQHPFFNKQLQQGADLGERMHHAFLRVFQAGYEKATLIGSDCPYLTPALLHQSYSKLQNSDVVIGPAEDGGYYLIALKRPLPVLFENITWSSEWVLQQTISKMERHSLSFFLLETLSDIDEASDWENYLQGNM